MDKSNENTLNPNNNYDSQQKRQKAETISSYEIHTNLLL